MHGKTLASLALLPLLAAGCNWTVFDDLRDQAPTRVFDEPDDYRTPNYGLTLATVSGPGVDGDVSRFAVGAGADSATQVFEGWTGTRVALRSLIEFCKFDGDCEDPIGTSLIGLPSWRGDEGGLCFLAAGGGFYRVECLSPLLEEELDFGGLAAGAAQAIGLGAAMAPLVDGDDPTPSATFGVAVAGAPAASGGTGQLFGVLDDGTVTAISPPMGVLDPGSQLGAAVAATRAPGGDFLVAAAAPGNPTGTPALAPRVLVFALSGASAELRACLPAPAGAEQTGFGGALAFGDVDGDGVPDLAVGAEADAPIAAEGVFVFGGADLPAAPVQDGDPCPGWGAAPTVVACAEDLRGVSCDGNGFGDAVALGDVDGDGDDDLVVGAPLSDVDGAGSSGAAYVFPGGPGGLVAADAAILLDSSPEADEELGRSVAMLPSNLGAAPRDEVLIGAPRGARFYAFLCTRPELADTDPENRCQPAD